MRPAENLDETPGKGGESRARKALIMKASLCEWGAKMGRKGRLCGEEKGKGIKGRKGVKPGGGTRRGVRWKFS